VKKYQDYQFDSMRSVITKYIEEIENIADKKKNKEKIEYNKIRFEKILYEQESKYLGTRIANEKKDDPLSKEIEIFKARLVVVEEERKIKKEKYDELEILYKEEGNFKAILSFFVPKSLKKEFPIRIREDKKLLEGWIHQKI